MPDENDDIPSSADIFNFVAESGIVIVTVAGPPHVMACEIGSAILLNKPLILVASPGIQVPSVLRLVAAAVVEVDSSDRDDPAVMAAIARVLADMEAEPAPMSRPMPNYRPN